MSRTSILIGIALALSAYWPSVMARDVDGQHAGEYARAPSRPQGTASANVGFEQLAREVTSGKLKSVEDVVCRLSAEERSHYVRMISSLSLQEATPNFPRVLTYREDGSRFVAFGGHESLRGGNTVEIAEADPKTSGYSFHEIEFPAKGKPIVRRNDPKCLNCHGDPPRPRFDEYFFWPGALGSEDDGVTVSDPRYIPSTDELNWKALFETMRMFHHRHGKGRYRCLEDLAVNYGQEVRPNFGLNDAIRGPKYASIARAFETDPDLMPLRYAQLALESGECSELKGFFPADLQRKIQGTLSAIEQNIYDTDKEATRMKQERYRKAVGHATVARAKDFDVPMITGYDPAIARLRFLIDGFSSHRLIEWSTDATMPDFEMMIRKTPGIEMTCEKLREHHLQSFPDTPENRARIERAIAKLKHLDIPKKTEPFTRCLPCHQAGNQPRVPRITFEDKASLMRALLADSSLKQKLLDRIAPGVSPEKRMPPTGPLTAEERNAIETFVGRVK